ncbi:GAF domain-containing protein [Sphingomonadaceae bacterium G21617-S1]|uniref:adenylate/guanylate cyclase domain-containing protein n=1 Tax=Rhizorhabdus sp. TaxID=1968843 RepID=UPI0011FF4514|nr:adenylate/guanylate cyclase domain-containing protein [Rhizorhabdus sp.]MBD3761892.1 GAF domain-containing protein [Rhizorhabdus sp.]MCZ4340382.1 GAF domain-containing protein [Sphingomonadaceae bacterium G21617-S1]TAK15729.1 MAG: GAF domain-containing protein [Rhizorhabdus sp.]
MTQMQPIMPIGDAAKAPRSSARALFWRLVWLYQGGCTTAIVITMALVLFGLEFNLRQWIALCFLTPIVVAIYNLSDVYLIVRHFRPIDRALRALDSGAKPPRPVIAEAVVRALNLPFYSFMRVTFLHGPMVSVLVCLALPLGNYVADTGFVAWQVIAFAATCLFFASPTHAIFEYFGVSRAMVPTIIRLSEAMEGGLPPEYQSQLVAIRLKSKLLYLTIFVAALPLIFFAASIIFKVQRMFVLQGIDPTPSMMMPLYIWITGVVLICMLGSVMMALLTAHEVSRSASRLIDGMRLVERGDLDQVKLEVVSTDEYADIFRGFQHMLEALREEQLILEVSNDLAGELKLELLIARIMRTTADLLNAERSTLFVYDRKTDELFSLFADGEHVREIRMPSNRGIAGAVFTSGIAENIPDPYADPRFNPEVDRATGFVTRSILCQPIFDKHGGRIGVTQILNKRDAAAFTAKDEARLRAFSAQIAVCLENARLFDDVLYMKNYNESILKSTSNAVITFDEEHRIVTSNEAARKLMGAPDGAIGMPAREAFSGRNLWIAERLERTDRDREAYLAVDAELVGGDGTASSINLTAAPLVDANDAVIGSMLVMEDITSEKRVRSTMARYMSKEVADQLLEAGEDQLTGKDQTVSILFSDVRGFTTIAEQIGARETVAMLNSYFTEMVDVIFEHKGILDKYIGDAIMALFGAPFAGPNDADNAIATANKMMVELKALNLKRTAAGEKPIDIGLGISTGNVIVGNIGSIKRMEYTVIGDSVNLASRLEGANKAYGSKILFSEFTHARLADPKLVREIDLIRVKGRDFPVGIHESLGYRADEIDRGLGLMLEHYAKGFTAYRAMAWREAEQHFLAALKAMPGDGPSAMYVERCRAFMKTPPGGDWDGVWTLTSK